MGVADLVSSYLWLGVIVIYLNEISHSMDFEHPSEQPVIYVLMGETLFLADEFPVSGLGFRMSSGGLMSLETVYAYCWIGLWRLTVS